MNNKYNSIAKIKNKIESSEFIYVIYSEYGFKIGITKSPLDRIEGIKQGLPSQDCFFIGLYMGKESAKFEKQLHNKFKKQQISGEWFFLNEENLDEIDFFLIKKGFQRMIKKSSLWANYILPSIFSKGKTKVIETINKKKKHQNDVNIENHFILKFIQKVENDSIADLEIKYMTSTQISEYLINLGYSFNPIVIGGILTNLKFLKKSKRVDGSVRKVYIVKLIESI